MSLTVGVHSRQNRCVHLRAAAASLLIVMTIGMSWLGACGGWDPSAARRMACCAGAEHECSQLGNADACCAAGEQRQNIEILAAAFVAPPPGLVLPLQAVPLAAHVWHSRDDSNRAWRTSGEARLLLSVFLI